MTRPNAITLNGQVVANNLTPKEQDIYALGELAGRAKALSDLRAKVNALLKVAEKTEWDRDVWLAMAYREVLVLIGESGNG